MRRHRRESASARRRIPAAFVTASADAATGSPSARILSRPRAFTWIPISPVAKRVGDPLRYWNIYIFMLILASAVVIEKIEG